MTKLEPTPADTEAADNIFQIFLKLQDNRLYQLVDPADARAQAKRAIATFFAKARQEGYDEGYNAGMSHVFCIDATTIKGNIIDFTGEVPVVRRVLGKLPVTKDGCVATINGTFYTPPDGDPDGICGMAAWAEGEGPVGSRNGFRVSYVGSDRTWNSSECYGTAEAAEAALAAKEANATTKNP